MAFTDELHGALASLHGAAGTATALLDRFKAEMDFAGRLVKFHPDTEAAWGPMILAAIGTVRAALADGGNVPAAIAAAEADLAPIGAKAKAYTIHCTGHAHIDMNWLWNWPETVATVNDTFTTVDRLMDEFPDFHFSQSQTSIYQILEDYLPELTARVKARVAEGRWEITSSQWVEGDKNLASGEIIARHLLYTRRFFKQHYGLAYADINIDWEPDTFGHAWTVPTILAQGKVTTYYHHRAANGPRLYWWQGKDGARLLAFDDRARGYNGQINAGIINGLLEFEQETGLQDFLFVFGVGDHGGGPTRRDLVMAVQMADWPIWPTVKLSTNRAFYDAAAKAQNLPVVDGEQNFVFEGCYTSQSNIKRANRKSENALVEAEMAALLGRGVLGMAYPADALYQGWRDTMFNQFHDILPGSGIHATYEYAQGLYQNTLAQTTMAKTRALRAIANQVDVMPACGCGGAAGSEPGANVGPGIGGGPGEIRGDATISRVGAGGVCCDPFVIFNPNPWTRSEVVTVPLWDREWHDDARLIVRDEAGNAVHAQVVERNPGWGHSQIGVAFPATNVPGLGYRAYSVMEAPVGLTATGASADRLGTIENEFYRVEVDAATGAIAHLVDKETGIDFVPEGGRIGLLEYELEAPHPMTAWVLGQVVKRVPLSNGAADSPLAGPYVATVRTDMSYGDSKFTQVITLYSGIKRIDFHLEANWLERGAPEIGVPTLRVNFPLAVTGPTATYEIPNGSITRPTDPKALWSQSNVYFQPKYNAGNSKADMCSGEVPALKWADLTGAHASGQTIGLTVLNDTKYGFQAQGTTLRMTLIRSSYDPDPLPELGVHKIAFAVVPHVGALDVSEATRQGYAFNLPLNTVGTTQHGGSLPGAQGFAEILTSNVMLSGMKKAEDSDALIVRLYEMEGQATTAQVKLAAALAPADAPAVQTDIMEEAIAGNTAKMACGVLSVNLPPYGMATVKIG
jgi:alpha-mannosidase